MKSKNRYYDARTIKEDMFGSPNHTGFGLHEDESSSSPFLSRPVSRALPGSYFPEKPVAYPSNGCAGMGLEALYSSPASSQAAASLAKRPTVAMRIGHADESASQLACKAARAARENDVNILLDVERCKDGSDEYWRGYQACLDKLMASFESQLEEMRDGTYVYPWERK